MKVSELLKQVKDHLDEYGDTDVIAYDRIHGTWRTLNTTLGEVQCEDDDWRLFLEVQIEDELEYWEPENTEYTYDI